MSCYVQGRSFANTHLAYEPRQPLSHKRSTYLLRSSYARHESQTEIKSDSRLQATTTLGVDVPQEKSDERAKDVGSVEPPLRQAI